MVTQLTIPLHHHKLDVTY